MVSVCPSVLSYHPGRGSRQVGNNCLGESVGHGAVGGTVFFFLKEQMARLERGSVNYPFFFCFFLGGFFPFFLNR